MATEFTLKSKAYDGRYMELRLKQTKNPSANTSTVAWTLTVTGGESNYYSTGPTTVKIGTVQACDYPRKSYSTHAFPTGKGSASGTVTLKHAEDGSCVVPVSLTTAIYTTTTSTVTGTWTLDANPRQSTICATSGNIEKTILVAVSRYVGTYTHSIRYSFGSLSGWVGAGGMATSGEVKHSNDSVAFTLPRSFYGQIPEATSGTGTLTCYTYNGSTLVGTSTCTFTAYTDKALCAPTVTGTVTDCNEKTLALTGDENVLVRYKSTALCTITAAARNSAGLTRKKIGTVTVTEAVRRILRVDTDEISFYAKDSRGYETEAVVRKTMIPYVRLTNNATVKRTNPTSGEAVVRLQGSCYYGSFGRGENTLVARYHIGARDTVELPVQIREDHTYDVSFTLAGFDYDKDLKFYVTMVDALSEAQKTIPVSRGVPVFDWGQSDFQFHVPVGFDQSVSGAYIRQAKVWGANTFRVQSKYMNFNDGGGNRQNIFLFGNMGGDTCMGVIGINSAGGCSWNGTTGITVAGEEGGIVCVTLKNRSYDYFMLLSAEPISIV